MTDLRRAADYSTDPRWAERLRHDAGPVDGHTQFAYMQRDLSKKENRIQPQDAPRKRAHAGHFILAALIILIFSPILKACGA
jgi:hypothetical protein